MAAAGSYQVKLTPSGLEFDTAGDLTLLEAANLAGISLPSSCRNGTCRTCLCHLSSGKVHHKIKWPGLSLDEKAAGWILPCVAVAESDLVADIPYARRMPAIKKPATKPDGAAG